MASSYTPEVSGGGFRARVQKLGGHLAGMVMPNIGAIIAWGLITALFIPVGWLPNENLAELVDPMIKYLLPVLIGYTGGRMVHGQRGAVVGATATMGVVVGADVPMFLGAMIIGPLTAYVLRLFDNAIDGRIKPGFEMLVDNFSAGIIGGGFAILGKLAIGPVVNGLTKAAGSGVDWLLDHSLMPLVSVLVEPAKVLFLNNAINHGVFSPLGVQQVAESGKSILFMIESNPGPGLGLLLAYFFFGPKSLRPTTPAAMIIHFFGGIHEIYFPYVLMKPRLILALMAGGASGVATFMIFGAGTVASPAPGSIFAFVAVTAKGSHVGMFLGVLIAAAVTFGVAALLLGFGKLKSDQEPDDDTTSEAKTPEEIADEPAVPAQRTASEDETDSTRKENA
ncbi:PTS mannitol transporter subunit IICB [Actinoplanes couchii]|uniref:PTS system mannitol-specific EIICB component n=1 Tax=Actinoplanes couchii TaxID=403638 RepID=A0ABQ3X3W2_9ACTN|nr:PTS mannitol transporter subunit IICB [Actinoplanes couchii]MDR6326446.1 PTS system mannitol-specific IIC component [Actinoplanes couchii]GID53202.1 PTS system mannitol-specific EIICB component [Actinoplanes couchii]